MIRGQREDDTVFQAWIETARDAGELDRQLLQPPQAARRLGELILPRFRALHCRAVERGNGGVDAHRTPNPRSEERRAWL